MKQVLLVLIGVVLGCTTCVIASNLIASNITYSPNDSTWGVNNVEAAIDSLYVSKTSNNYSADEKVVGTWTDGKPLYQKTIKIENYTQNWNPAYNWSDFGVVSIDKIFKVNSGYAHYYYSDSDFWFSEYNRSTSDYFTILVGDTGFRIGYSQGADPLKEIYFTIQYTKTTDQAQS